MDCWPFFLKIERSISCFDAHVLVLEIVGACIKWQV